MPWDKHKKNRVNRDIQSIAIKLFKSADFVLETSRSRFLAPSVFLFHLLESARTFEQMNSFTRSDLKPKKACTVFAVESGLQ